MSATGNVTLETIQRYVEQQGTKERPHIPKNTALPPPGLTPSRGNAQLSVQPLNAEVALEQQYLLRSLHEQKQAALYKKLWSQVFSLKSSFDKY